MLDLIGSDPVRTRAWRVIGLPVLVLSLAACSTLPAPQTVNPTLYRLEALPPVPATTVKRDIALAVSETQAQIGFDTAQIAYVQKQYELNYYVTSRWVAPPAQLITPLLLQTLAQTGGYRAVVPVPGAVPAEFRLDTELLRLQQDFRTQPSRVQITVRAQLIDVRGKRVVAVQQFDVDESADSEDAYGGVRAANRLVQRVLGQLADFCLEASAIR